MIKLNYAREGDVEALVCKPAGAEQVLEMVAQQEIIIIQHREILGADALHTLEQHLRPPAARDQELDEIGDRPALIGDNFREIDVAILGKDDGEAAEALTADRIDCAAHQGEGAAAAADDARDLWRGQHRGTADHPLLRASPMKGEQIRDHPVSGKVLLDDRPRAAGHSFRSLWFGQAEGVVTDDRRGDAVLCRVRVEIQYAVAEPLTDPGDIGADRHSPSAADLEDPIVDDILALAPWVDQRKADARGRVDALRTEEVEGQLACVASQAQRLPSLRGASQVQEAIIGGGSGFIVCEMSLSPLYAGAPTIAELCGLLAALGFQCVALGPEFEDPRTGELLQVDGVFVARDVAGRH